MILSKQEREYMRKLSPSVDLLKALDSIDNLETILVKYIEHVGREEGTDFLVNRCERQEEPGLFTDEEWEFLQIARDSFASEN
jgi:hypothetical protein